MYKRQVQNLCESNILLEVPPASFDPAPKVNSGVIHLQPRPTPIVPEARQLIFNNLVKTAFAQRRKTLRNNLIGLLTEKQIIDVGIDPSLRAEVLEITQFAELSRAVEENPPS